MLWKVFQKDLKYAVWSKPLDHTAFLEKLIHQLSWWILITLDMLERRWCVCLELNN